MSAALLALLASAASAPAPAGAQTSGYHLSKVAVSGDPAPGGGTFFLSSDPAPGGGFFGSFNSTPPGINPARTAVAFGSGTFGSDFLGGALYGGIVAGGAPVQRLAYNGQIAAGGESVQAFYNSAAGVDDNCTDGKQT